MGNPAAEQLIQQAMLALRRLSEATMMTEEALAALDGIAKAWSRRPFRIGIGGQDPVGRASVFDAACGGGVLAVAGRVPGAPPLSVRRGPATRCRVVRDAADPEEHVFVPRGRRAPTSLDEAHRELSRREHELAELERSLHALVHVVPRRWAFWLWPIRWLRRWRAKAQLASRDRAVEAIDAARRRVVEADPGPVDDRPPLAEFFTVIRDLRAGVTEIEIELASGPLADGVELIELAGAARAADVDATLVVAAEGVLVAVGGGASVRVGDVQQVIRALPVFLVHARALNLAHRVCDRVDAARLALDDVLDQAQVDFVARIDRLEALRVRDRAGLRASQLEHLKSQIDSHVSAVMEHASTHLGTQLEQLTHAWTESIARAAASDQLKAAVAHIDLEWPATAQRIAREVGALVAGGIGGSAHDLHAELVAPLGERGFVEQRARPEPVIRPIAMLPSLTNPTAARWGGTGDWFTGLFRSFQARRKDIAAKASQRADHVRRVARAEMLDAEPVLHAALSAALDSLLEAAIERHTAWLDHKLAIERVAIDREQIALARLRLIRDNARRDSRELADQINTLELDLPATAAAAAAARLGTPW